MNTATVYELTPGQLRRATSRQASESSQASKSSVFSDMADGVTVLQHFFNFAHYDESTFEHKETKFVLLIAGLCGDGGRILEMFDEELAEHAGCTDRTIRQWRSDYLTKTKKLNYFPLQITEGEYDSTRKRYGKTSYTIHPETAEAMERAVVEARAMPEYETNRLKALERAAADHYDDIPNAPAKSRTRKPKKSQRSPVIQSINNATKNLDKGKIALAELPTRERAALLAGQGEELRATLLEMRGKIDELLSEISEDVDYKGVSDIPEISSGIPPPAPKGESANSHFRVREEEARKHSPVSIDAWNKLEERLKAPQVRRVEIELCSSELPQSPDVEKVPEEPEHFVGAPSFDSQPEPSELVYEPDDAEIEVEVDPIELAEAEAAQAESNILLSEVEPTPEDSSSSNAKFQIGDMVYPTTEGGVRLHNEPSRIVEARRTEAGSWQYRMKDFTQWRDEHLYELATAGVLNISTDRRNE